MNRRPRIDYTDAQISRALVASQTLRSIGARLGRSPSTVSRELTRNGGGYDVPSLSLRESTSTREPRERLVYCVARSEQRVRDAISLPKEMRFKDEPLLAPCV